MPDIPITGTGRPQAELAQGMMDLGRALSGLRAPAQAAAQTIIDVAAYTQATKAKQFLDTSFTLWAQNIEADPEPGTLMERWLTDREELIQKAGTIATLPQAHKMFQEYIVGASQKATDRVAGVVSKRSIIEAETVAQEERAIAIRQGDIERYDRAVMEQKARGILSEEDVRAAFVGRKEVLRNKAMNDLVAMGDIDEQIAASMDQSFVREHDLDPTDDTITKSLIFKKDTLAKQETEAQTKWWKKTYDGFLAKSLAPGDPERGFAGRDEMVSYARMLAGSAYGDDVRGWIDNYDKEAIKRQEIIEKYNQESFYGQKATSMELWTGQGKMPWTMDDASAWLTARTIDEPEYNALRVLYSSTMDDISKGRRKGSVNYEDPTKVNELWSIARDVFHGWGTTEKLRLIHEKNYLGRGVTGEKMTQIENSIDALENNPERKRYLGYVNLYFDTLLNSDAVKGDEAKVNALIARKATTAEAFIEFMNKNPDNKNDIWQTQVNQVKGEQVKVDVLRKFQDELGARYPSGLAYFFGQGLTPEMGLEAGREAFPELMESAAFKGEWEAGLPKVAREEIRVLNLNGIKNITKTVRVGDDQYYFEGTKNVYLVRGVPSGEKGVVRQIIYKKKMEQGIDGQWHPSGEWVQVNK